MTHKEKNYKIKQETLWCISLFLSSLNSFDGPSRVTSQFVTILTDQRSAHQRGVTSSFSAPPPRHIVIQDPLISHRRLQGQLHGGRCQEQHFPSERTVHLWTS